jgi:hypothetical protein
MIFAGARIASIRCREAPGDKSPESYPPSPAGNCPDQGIDPSMVHWRRRASPGLEHRTHGSR